MRRLLTVLVAVLSGFVSGAEMRGEFPGGKGFAVASADATNLTVTITRFHGRKESRVANLTRHDDAIYQDDSAEVFIGLPGRRDFVHLIGNTRGALYDDLTDENGRAHKKWNSGAKVTGRYDDAADSFVVTFVIPLASIAPPDGTIALACGAHVHYQLESVGCWGRYFHPETFTRFETPWRRPVVKPAPEPVFPGVGELPEDRRQTMLEVTRRSDIIWKGEPMRYTVRVHEVQTEPVEIEIFDGKARFRYKKEIVEIPHETDSSPWEEK